MADSCPGFSVSLSRQPMSPQYCLRPGSLVTGPPERMDFTHIPTENWHPPIISVPASFTWNPPANITTEVSSCCALFYPLRKNPSAGLTSSGSIPLATVPGHLSVGLLLFLWVCDNGNGHGSASVLPESVDLLPHPHCLLYA